MAKLIKNKKNPVDIARKLASEKALSVSTKNPNKTTVGCDTIIVLNKEVISKAKDRKTAEKKILKLSGKKHKIISAVSVYKNKKKIWGCVETTVVEIRKLTKKEVKHYLGLCGKDVLSSVGCYQIERFGPIIIKKIQGDFFNVMGFPLFHFLNFIKKLNTKTWLRKKPMW